MQVVIWHIYRECNAGADYLACMASRRLSGKWLQFNDVPHLLKGILKVSSWVFQHWDVRSLCFYDVLVGRCPILYLGSLPLVRFF